MAIHLQSPLDKLEDFQLVKEYADKGLREFGHEEYRVIIRHSTPEEEEQILTEDRSIHTTFDPTSRTMEVIIGIGKTHDFDYYKSFAPNIPDQAWLNMLMEMSPVDDPKEFAELCIVDMLNMFLEKDEDVD